MLDALGLGLEDVGLLGPGLVLGALGLGLEEVSLLLVVHDGLGLGLEEVGLVRDLLFLAPRAPSLVLVLVEVVLGGPATGLVLALTPAPSASYVSCRPVPSPLFMP